MAERARRTRGDRAWKAFALIVACVPIASALALLAAPRSLARVPEGVRIDRLVIYKNQHVMEAYRGAERVGTYPVAVGAGGPGPKLYEGDGHTPEGDYRIDSRHRSARFHRFLHVSYPNEADRARYREAVADGRVPAGRGIGGDIGIHGESDRAFVRLTQNRFDWTSGCVAVNDGAIDELYRAVVPNAVVEIRANRPAPADP